MNRAIAVRLDLGTPRVGLWCPTHALPHAFEVDLWLLGHSGLAPMGTIRRCHLDQPDQTDDSTGGGHA